MRFAKLCVLEIGKNAGRVEGERCLPRQMAGQRSILCAVILDAAVDKGIVEVWYQDSQPDWCVVMCMPMPVKGNPLRIWYSAARI